MTAKYSKLPNIYYLFNLRKIRPETNKICFNYYVIDEVAFFIQVWVKNDWTVSLFILFYFNKIVTLISAILFTNLMRTVS